jgi:Tfp pilus assembly protein PilF
MNDLIRRQPLLPCLVLFAIVLWTFWPAVHNGFVGYDDPVYVTGNGHVQQGLSWKNVEWAFTASDGGNWHPLTWFSHMVDCQLFRLSPWGHHFTSVLFHALNAVLVFLALRCLTQETDPGGARATWRSFIVAALFALHPLRVESVAWIAERKDVLSAFFFILTLLVYGRYVVAKSQVQNPLPEGNPSGGNSQRSRHLYLLTLLLFALGLMSKPMLVTLPFVLLLLDYWPLRRWKVQNLSPQAPQKQDLDENTAGLAKSTAVHLLIEKIPLFAITAILSLITILVQRKEGAMSLAVPLLGRVENAVISYCRYIGKTFYPHNFAFFYPYESRWPLVAIVLAALLFAAISVLAIYWRRERPYLLTGWLWFVGTLIPVIGLIQVGEQALADRYTYLPSLGFFLALVWGAHELTRRWQFQRSFLGLFAAALGLICALKTRDQITTWKNNETLFTHAIAVTRKNYIALNNLGATFEKQGRWDEAAAQFRQAIADKPEYAQAHRNLGLVFERQGQPNRAIEEYREAMRLNPAYADPHNALGALFNSQGRVDEAVQEFQQALRLKPDYADAHFNLGLLYARKGLLDEAIREYQAVLEVQPNRADVHNNLGVALDSKERIDDAIREYVQAIELEPGYARARFNLGVALSRKGTLAPAIEQFQEALKLQPDYKEARTNLDVLLQMQKKAER